MRHILQDALYRAYLRWFGALFVLLAIGILADPARQALWGGLLLGTGGSLMILTLQRLSVDRMYRVIETGRKPMSRGTVSRMAVAVLCVMVAVGAVIGILAGILLGPAEPMSVSALVIALVTQLAVAAVTVVFLVMLTRIYLQLASRSVTVPETAA